MPSLDRADPGRVLAGTTEWLDAAALERLSAHPLDCLDTEFPHHARTVESPDDPARPSETHPVFYGCFDWHSSVHSHWCLFRQLRLFDDHPAATDIVDSVDARLTPGHVERELASFGPDSSFERPYGWAWFLRLAAELHLWDDDRAARWRETLRPLEARIVDLVRTDLLGQSRPCRVGTHGNTAFALQCVLDYAHVTGDDALAAATGAQSRRLFADDRRAPLEYEPFGWDFLSPSLMEADLMRRVLPSARFAEWLDGFLPDATDPSVAGFLEPVDVVSDDGDELHLVGLNLTKAWCLSDLADSLPTDRETAAVERSARRHADRGLSEAFTDAYAGAHWLSSFVLYLLSRHDGGVAPTR
jgi:hypothetical protein